jgi:hypothetical protein
MAGQDDGAATTPVVANDGVVNYGDVKLRPAQAEALARYLAEGIEQAESDTAEYRERLVGWRKVLDPLPYEKPFPWPHASSLKIPIPRIVIDSLCSTAKRAITQQKQKFIAAFAGGASAAGIEPGEEDKALRAVERFCEAKAMDPACLDLRGLIDEWFEEQLVSAMGAVKLINETMTFDLVTEAGKEAHRVTTRRGPRMLAVPTGTMVWPSGLFRTVQSMPFIGNWVELTPSTLRERQDGWGYKNVDAILAAGANSVTVGDADTQHRLDSIGMQPGEKIRVHEMYLRWRMEAGGPQHDLMVTLHVPSRKLLRVKYNPLGDGQYPYEIGVASPRVGAVPGRSIIEPMADPCQGIDTAINQTFDSQTLANAPCIRFPEDSPMRGAMSDGFFPGMPMPYKDKADEISLLEFPAPSGTSFQMVSFLLNIVERLTRIGPPRLGDVSQAQRTPASLGLSMQQLGAELIDEFIDRGREIIGRLYTRALRLYYIDDPDVFVRTVGEDGRLIRTIIEASLGNGKPITEMLSVTLYASSANRNREMERQLTFTAAQTTMGWYKDVIQLVNLIVQTRGNDEVQKVLLAILRGSQTWIERLAELTDQPDANILVPDLVSLLTPQAGAAPAGFPGSVAGAAPAGPPDAAAMQKATALALGGGISQ